jgi:hypothetical protein
MMRALNCTIAHFFGSWQEIFAGARDGRHPDFVIYPLPALLSAGTLMFLFQLQARRQITYQLRENGPSRSKFQAWFGIEMFPHGDTLNYAFKKISPAKVQEVVCAMVARLIRKKVLYPYRLYDNFLVAMDGTGVLTFHQRHCEHCLTKKLNNGETLYYHPVLEAKLVCANGFVFSLMTEFIENASPQDSKQDCVSLEPTFESPLSPAAHLPVAGWLICWWTNLSNDPRLQLAFLDCAQRQRPSPGAPQL